MEFIWKMTEENWKNMMHDANVNDYDELSKDYNFYGQLYIGDYCIEFVADDAGKDGILMFTNIYQLFIDDGYGEDKNGIPYSLTDLYIDIPKANKFEDFKNLCERQFAAGVGLYFNEKVANKKCEWWQVKGE